MYICICICINHTGASASAYFSSHFLHKCPYQLNIFCNSSKTGHDAGWTAVTCLGEPQVGLLKLDIRRTNEPDSGLVARKVMILSQKKTSIKNGNMSASIWCYGQLLGPASAHGGVHWRRVTEHKPVSCGAMNLESYLPPPLQSWKVVTLTKTLVGAGKSCGSAETSGSQKESRGLVGNSCSSLAFVGKNLFLPHFP